MDEVGVNMRAKPARVPITVVAAIIFVSIPMVPAHASTTEAECLGLDANVDLGLDSGDGPLAEEVCTPWVPSPEEANDYLTGVQAAQGLGGCRSVPSGTGARGIYEIYYDSYGCRVPLRYGHHDYSTHRGYGYHHILARRGKWTDFMRNLTRNAVVGVLQKAESGSSRVKCYNYTVNAQPGKPNERTWRVVIEYGSEFKGIITAYWRPGHYNC